MIYFCPFVAETKEGPKDFCAVKRNNRVDFLDRSGNIIKEEWRLKGFRSMALKEMWDKEIAPSVTMEGFDPVI